ncbi:MAG TPA: hypothetical protein VFS95_13485 [Telluria sp.]|nr:hypothetical protein [Telluria sp.]
MTTDTAGEAQSIGADSAQPIDGIAGTHAGNQEPAGADVNAGVDPADQALHDTKVAESKRNKLQDNQTVYPSNQGFNGSLVRGGKAVGVYLGCGSLSRR